MRAEDLSRMLHGRRVGKNKYVAKCPVHGDKNGSLYITQGKDGGVWPHCFAGCRQEDILNALGLGWGDIHVENKVDPFWAQQQRDREHLALLERQEGLAIMAEQVFPGGREHWEEVESTCALEARELRDKLNPTEAAERKKQEEVQRIISEYADELMECAYPHWEFDVSGPHNLPVESMPLMDHSDIDGVDPHDKCATNRYRGTHIGPIWRTNYE